MAQKKPTVLFLASWYPTPNNKSHGIFIHNHALALSNFCNVIVAYAYSVSGNQQTVIHKNQVNQNFEEWILPFKKTSIQIPIVSALIKYLRFKNAYKIIATSLQKAGKKIDAIQLNAIYPAAIALPEFKKLWRVKHTVLEHWTGYLPEDGNYKGLLLKYYTRKTIASASKIWYVSEAQKNAMESHGLNGNYELIYNVVNTDVFKPTPRSIPQKPLLLHVSSLDTDQKNIDGILRVIQKLNQKNQAFDFLFVGGSKELINHYRNLSDSLNLSNTRFHGSASQQEIAQFMQMATAFVLFSNYENMPVVALEALACGLPLISTNTGYLEKMIRPEFGKLIPIADENKLEEILQLVVDGKLVFDVLAMNAWVRSKASYEVIGRQLYEHYCSEADS